MFSILNCSRVPPVPRDTPPIAPSLALVPRARSAQIECDTLTFVTPYASHLCQNTEISKGICFKVDDNTIFPFKYDHLFTLQYLNKQFHY